MGYHHDGMAFGHHLRKCMHRRMSFGVGKGDFRLLMLLALSEKPMHGYALIQEIGRTYQKPISAGLVYPALQELEDRGYLISEQKEGRKIYSVTPEGRKYLKDNKEIADRIRLGRDYAEKIGRFGFMGDIRDIQAMIMMNEEYLREDKMKRIEEIMSEAKKKVASIVFE